MGGGARIAVVGAGLMGHGIAQTFAEQGFVVAIQDPDPDVLSSVPERVRRNLELAGRDTSAAAAIELRPALADAVADADFVFEAAPERVELKQRLFAELDRLTAPEAVLATNTSVIAIADIARDATRPERIVGTHWWNPPYLVPLVEVVEAQATDQHVVARTIDLLEQAGKSPVHIRRDIPGFVGNRLQHALWREAFALVDAGVCEAATIDRVVKEGFGLRLAALGPMENADLVGLDLTLAIHDYLLPHLDRTPGPAPILQASVERGDLGMKSGKGFLEWTDEDAQATRDRLLRHLVGAQETLARPR